MITKAKEILAGAKDKMAHAVTHLDEELKTYRAGKANPLVFNNVMVDYYGCPTPLPQVASVTTPDAKTLMLQPWEKKMIPVIEKAILDANIGLTPSNNGESIRCTVPPLTEDRLKKAKGAGENAKVSVRNARRDAIEHLKKANKEGMPEDLQKEYEQLIQKETDAFSKKIDELVVAKEKEMMTV